MFPLTKPYVFGESEWKERDLGNEKFMPKIIGKSFLEKYDHTLLSEKENELLEILGTKILMNQWMLWIIQKLMKSSMNCLIR